MKIGIVTDTSSGISFEEAKKMGISLISLPFIIDDVEYLDKDVTKEEFYKLLKDGKSIHTSQSPVETVASVLMENLKEYDEVVYFPIEKGLSSTYEVSVLMQNEEPFKDKVFVVDHGSIACTMRVIINEAIEYVKKGYDAKKIKELCEKRNGNNIVYIALETLENLKKGGRVSPLVAATGNLLQIKPIMYSDGGKFDMVKKARNFDKAKEMLLSLLEETMKDKFNDTDINHYNIGLAYVNDISKAEDLKLMIKNKYPDYKREIIIDELAPVIACHIGEGALGLTFNKVLDEI